MGWGGEMKREEGFGDEAEKVRVKESTQGW